MNMYIDGISVSGYGDDNLRITDQMMEVDKGHRHFDNPDDFDEMHWLYVACIELGIEPSEKGAVTVGWSVGTKPKESAPTNAPMSQPKTSEQPKRKPKQPSDKVTVTRERWLTDLVHELDALLFENAMPKFRITCGFPSRGGLGKVKRVIGQCWSPNNSDDGTTEIIMTITEDDLQQIAGTVAHEMVHAIVGIPAGHGKLFRALAIQIGLEGKMTATTSTEAFKQSMLPIFEKLGEYPHSKLDGSTLKKQSTRMKKAVCDCGYTCRLSNKWASLGAPICPICKIEMTME